MERSLSQCAILDVSIWSGGTVRGSDACPGARSQSRPSSIQRSVSHLKPHKDRLCAVRFLVQAVPARQGKPFESPSIAPDNLPETHHEQDFCGTGSVTKTAWPLHLLERLSEQTSRIDGARRLVSQYPNPNAVSSESQSLGSKEASTAGASDLLTILQARLQAAALERSIVTADKPLADPEASGDPSLSPSPVESALKSLEGADEREGEGALPSCQPPKPYGDPSYSRASFDSEFKGSSEEGGVVAYQFREHRKKRRSQRGASRELFHPAEKGQARWINPQRRSSQPDEKAKVALADGKSVWRSSSCSPDPVAADDGAVVGSSSKQYESLSDARKSHMIDHRHRNDEAESGAPSGREQEGAASEGVTFLPGVDESQATSINPGFDVEATAKRQLDRRRQSHWSASTSSQPPSLVERLPASLVSTFTLLNIEGSESLSRVVASLGQKEDVDERAWGLLVRQLAAAGNLEAALECHGSLVQRRGAIPMADALGLIKAIE